MVSLQEKIQAYGHPNVSATHRSTIEVTTEPNLTPKGDCIIATSANRGASDLRQELKELLKREDTRVTLTIRTGNLHDTVHGTGNPRLTFQNPFSMVFRKSTYTCGRTVMIHCDKAAADINRSLVNTLRKKTPVELTLEAEA